MAIGTSRASGPFKRRVMVVDDDPEVVQILTVNLAHADLDVISARNGAQALIKAARDRPDIILLDAVLPDHEGLEVCRRLKESRSTGHIPVIIMGAENEGEASRASVLGGADHYVAKPFDPNDVIALVKAHFRHVDRDTNVHPLSRLPDQTQLSRKMAGLNEQGRTFAVICVDIDDLNAFNHACGFAEGDRSIRVLADVLRDAVRMSGNTGDLAGHLGGDNFIVISTVGKARGLCRRVIAEFDGRIRALYQQRDLERGFVQYQGRQGKNEQSPIMTLSIAVITNERRPLHHPLQIAEAAAELHQYLRHRPGSNYYIEREEGGPREQPAPNAVALPGEGREELGALQRVLAWASLLAEGLESPAIAIRDCIDALEAAQRSDSPTLSPERPTLSPERPTLSPERPTLSPEGLAAMRGSVRDLLHAVRELRDLSAGDWVAGDAFIDELDLASTFEWLLAQVRERAEQSGVVIRCEGADSVGRLLLDGRGLAYGLLCLLRSVVGAAQRGDTVRVAARQADTSTVIIDVNNSNQRVSQREMNMLVQGRLVGMMPGKHGADLYLAKVLVQGVGGKLTVESGGASGTTVTISLPRRWQSSADRIEALLSAAETSRHEARAELENIRLLLSSSDPASPALAESVDNLAYKVQELLVLCNRSLFLADDLSARLESGQDRVLGREAEQLATLEAMLVISKEMSSSAGVDHLFDAESARRVVRNVLLMADEFKLSRGERQALHHAAMLKDLGLVSCPEAMLEDRLVASSEEAVALRKRFSVMWRSLSRLSFLSPALVLIWHRHERHDGAGHPFGVSGPDIPLGARILAVADAFDAMITGLPDQAALTPEAAVQELAADSGQRFDADVVSAFLRVWRRREFDSIPGGAG